MLLIKLVYYIFFQLPTSTFNERYFSTNHSAVVFGKEIFLFIWK